LGTEAGAGGGRTWRDRISDTAPAVSILLLHLAFLPGYGVFRDELYYIACGRRPGWGYVDHPPLVGWVAWLVAQVGGESHLTLRVAAALVMAATVWLSGRIAGAIGGGPFARVLAGLATGLSPIALSLASIYSMNVFDLFFWALLGWILVRVLSGGPERLWLAFGAVAGLGLLNKISVLYLGAGLVAGLVLARRFDVFRSRWLWGGGLLAVLVFLPHLGWQHAHGWPTLEFMANARQEKMAPLSPLGFALGAVEQTLPVAWLWLAGVVWLLVSPRSARLRPLGVSFLAVLGILAFAGGKPYYLAAAYALPLAAGAVALEGSTAAGRARSLRPLALLLVAGLGAVAAPLARPMLRVDDFVRYAAALGQEPGTDERHALGRLPQFYADMHGWRELAEAVAGVVHALPAGEQAELCVFGQNYGEAGAIEYFARELDLPPAISSHNSYWLWGPGRCSGAVLVVIGGRRERLAELFEEVEERGVSRCQDCMPYENGLSIRVVRRPRRRLAELWPQIRRFI
jgi:hypothetical protein